MDPFVDIFNHIRQVSNQQWHYQFRELVDIDVLINTLTSPSASTLDQTVSDAIKNPKRDQHHKITPLHLLKENTTQTCAKLLLKYLNGVQAIANEFLRKFLQEEPPSAFNIFTPVDDTAKAQLDEWMLKLLDGPELYHILGLVELPITINVPWSLTSCDIRLETFFNLYKDLTAKIPGFCSSLQGLHTRHAILMTASLLPDIQPNQYQITDPEKEDPHPQSLPHHVSLFFSPIDNKCCFSYAHSRLTDPELQSIVGIPSFNKPYGAWRYAKSLDSNSTSIDFNNISQEELKLILTCDAVQKFYQKIRPLYIGPEKPGAFQLLKDWMSFGSIHLANIAVAKSLLYSQCSWPHFITGHPYLTMEEVTLLDLKTVSWPQIRQYFLQLLRRYETIEAIPEYEKSMLYTHFLASIKAEDGSIRHQAIYPNLYFHQHFINLSLLFANMCSTLEQHNETLVFKQLFRGILLGKISSYYLLNIGLIDRSLDEIEVDNYRGVNIKPKLRTDCFPSNPEEVVEGLMKILYDIAFCCGNKVADFKSKLFSREFTEENSINILSLGAPNFN